MKLFPATYFSHTVRYPSSGERMQLGGSYIHTEPDPAPDQRVFQLTLHGMQFFCDGQGGVLDNVHVERNMKVLDDFYLEHKLHKSFAFEHPFYGPLVCKFNQPLEIPEGVPGGNGLLNDVRVELLEIP